MHKVVTMSVKFTIPVLLTITLLLTNCDKPVIPPAGNLIDNYSFELGGSYSDNGWQVNNTTYSTLVPENGGDFSMKIFADTFPDEGYATFEVLNLTGAKTINLSCMMNTFGGLLGKVQLLQQSGFEGFTELDVFETSDNSWQSVNLSANATFTEGDVLVVKLNAGSSVAPIASQFALFDLVALTIN